MYVYTYTHIHVYMYVYIHICILRESVCVCIPRLLLVRIHRLRHIVAERGVMKIEFGMARYRPRQLRGSVHNSVWDFQDSGEHNQLQITELVHA